MERDILELLKKENKALYPEDIGSFLGVQKTEDYEQLFKILYELEKKMQIRLTNKGKYILDENPNRKTGILEVKEKGFGFVLLEEEDIFIPRSNMNGALHGDEVIAEITSKKGEKLEGKIIQILKRNISNLVGEVHFKKKDVYIYLEDPKIHLNVILKKEFTRGLVDGDKVVVKLEKQIKENLYSAILLSKIGHKDDPGVDILTIAAEHEIYKDFNEDAIEELKQIPDHVLETEYEQRKDHDLREKVIFTIDGEDTKDVDDAISISKKEDGNYILGVHIADVSHYVKPGSALDKEAYRRGTSSYLADRVIPMLPHQLSNGICSLNEMEDRLAMSCIMEIDSKGDVIDYDIFESIIRSKKKMTYKKVNEILEKNSIPEGYEEYEKSLLEMQELAQILRKNKIRRGYIDFNIDEAKIIVNEKGEAIDVVLRERGVGENMIEDFMIVANETVASHIYYMELPFLYRIHEKPEEEKISSFLKYVSILGYKLVGKVHDLRPTTMQNILKQLEDKKEYSILSKQLLRCMKKAIYDSNNVGHFGLGSNCYTHFTSPIRRYPDKMVHQLLKTYLVKKDLSNETIRFYEQALPEIAFQSSERERQSVECEREVDNMKMAEYMEKHIGEHFKGMISGITSWGIYVELPNLIEGMIRIDSLNGEYVYEEEACRLVSTSNQKNYSLGDSIEVVVTRASKILRQIDFEDIENKVNEEENGNQ